MSQVLVIGGSGFIGRQVCKTALNSGHNVRSISRSGRPQVSGSWTSEVEWISADLYEPNVWRDQLVDCQSVIHSVGGTDESSTNGITFERLNGDGAIISGLEAERAEVESFVFVSASTKPPWVRDAYIEAKRRAERAIFDLDFRVVVLRPGPIYGEGNPHLPRLMERGFRALDRDWLMTKLGEMHPLSVETVGRAASRVAFDSTAEDILDIPTIRKQGQNH